MHGLEDLESLIHMFTCFTAESDLQFGEGISKFMFICSDKFRALLTVKHEIELRDGLDLECSGSFSIVVALDGAEYYMLIFVGPTIGFESGFESHARRASGRPEIYNYTLIITDNCLQLHQ